MPRPRIAPVLLAPALLAVVVPQAVAAADPAAVVTLFGGGFQLTTVPQESITQTRFGDPYSAATRRVAAALGAPIRRTVRGDCAADALVTTRYRGGLRLIGRSGRLAGWVLSGRGPITTVDGIRVGTPIAAVRAAWPAARVRRTPRGTVLAGPGLRSLHAGSTDAAVALWSGDACIRGVAAVPQEAGYALGAPGTDAYEALTFIRTDEDRLRVTRSTGVDRSEQTASPLASPAGALQLRVAGDVMRVSRSGAALRVEGPGAAPARELRWEYRGPVNGVGTFCGPCLAPTDAMAFVVRHFLNGRPAG